MATALAASTWMWGPPCSPGNTPKSILAAISGSVAKSMAPRGPQSVLWVVKLVTWAWPTGLFRRPAATIPAKCAMSASKMAPTESAISRMRAQSMSQG